MYPARKNFYKPRIRKLLSRISKGFTIIELVVVVLIMFLVFSAGMANLRGYQRRRVLDGAVVQVKSHLRHAQQLALSNAKPEECITGNLPMISVRFNIDSTSTYSILAWCSDGTTTLSPSISTHNIVDSYPGVSISASSNPVIFNSQGKGVVDQVDITLTQTSSGDFQTLRITRGGEISPI